MICGKRVLSGTQSPIGSYNAVAGHHSLHDDSDAAGGILLYQSPIGPERHPIRQIAVAGTPRTPSHGKTKSYKPPLTPIVYQCKITCRLIDRGMPRPYKRT